MIRKFLRKNKILTKYRRNQFSQRPRRLSHHQSWREQRGRLYYGQRIHPLCLWKSSPYGRKILQISGPGFIEKNSTEGSGRTIESWLAAGWTSGHAHKFGIKNRVVVSKFLLSRGSLRRCFCTCQNRSFLYKNIVLRPQNKDVLTIRIRDVLWHK